MHTKATPILMRTVLSSCNDFKSRTKMTFTPVVKAGHLSKCQKAISIMDPYLLMEKA